jgi:dTMP kinase
VLSDRYLLSSLAYQGASVPVKWVAEINRTARAPDLTLFLEVSAKTAARRRAARGGAAELFEDDEQQRRIARAYAKSIESHGRGQRVKVIDGEQSLEQVTAECLAAIRKLLGQRR